MRAAEMVVTGFGRKDAHHCGFLFGGLGIGGWITFALAWGRQLNAHSFAPLCPLSRALVTKPRESIHVLDLV